METTERIVEAYVRHVKHWATIANIRCAGQNEIDLVAIDPLTLERYHIEVSISISQSYRELTTKPFDPEKIKQRVHKAGQRRTLGFFAERKFAAPGVVERLKELGFEGDNYRRVIVTWGWRDAVTQEAEAAGIVLWDFRTIISEIADTIRGSREYFTDDTLRTLNLFIHASDEANRQAPVARSPARQQPKQVAHEAPGEGFWVYENSVHEYASVHRAACASCRNGRGMHGKGSTATGQWMGPFVTAIEALERARQTGRNDIRTCGACTPNGSS